MKNIFYFIIFFPFNIYGQLGIDDNDTLKYKEFIEYKWNESKNDWKVNRRIKRIDSVQNEVKYYTFSYHISDDLFDTTDITIRKLYENKIVKEINYASNSPRFSMSLTKDGPTNI